MNSSYMPALLAGSSILVLAFGAEAQTTTTVDRDAVSALEEIIVTARRREESLQDVPQTVNAVTSESLEQYNIRKFEDISSLVPGLTLSSGNTGYNSAASVRGVSFQVESQSTPTVEMYLNEVPVEPNTMFQANFDISQIEVLRGPQGTLRGRSAPSGAITTTTRRPDMSEVGGSANMTVNDREGYNVQAAIGLPLVQDKLAIRLAGLFDENDVGGIDSANNPQDPVQRTKGFRGTARFEPTDTLSATLMYQHLERHSRTFDGIVLGDGSPAHATHAAGYNGPPLTAHDRMSVQDFASANEQKFDVATLQAGWRFARQQLSYVGGYSKTDLEAVADLDGANTLPGHALLSTTAPTQERLSHELRLGSDERIGGVFDYSAGLFYMKTTGETPLQRHAGGSGFFPGSFGSPLSAANPFIFDERYSTQFTLLSKSEIVEKAAFATVTLHLWEHSELSLGGRQIWIEVDKSSTSDYLPVLRAIPNAAVTCPANFAGRTYPGTCDLAINIPGGPLPNETNEDEEEPFVYSASFTHRFNEDWMAYASYGTSWRQGPGPITGAPTCVSADACRQYRFLDSEDSRGLELGLKTTLLDDRATVAVAAYGQEYDGLFVYGGAVPYLSNNGTVANGQFTYNADAIVKGVDLDIGLRPTSNWSLGLTYSYAKGNYDDALVPCRDSNFDGIPDSDTLPTTPAAWTAAGGPPGPALCKSDATTTGAVPWSANVRTEYSVPMFAGHSGFVRALWNYYPKNTNRPPSSSFEADSYNLLNLFVGLRSDDGAWEVSVFGKNVLEDDTVLSRGTDEITMAAGPTFGTSGYRSVTTAPRPEYGLSLHYSFASR
jgi:iron complex outermembrane receptor protein